MIVQHKFSIIQDWLACGQEDSMDEGGGEMRFSLPAAPSPGPLLFLLAACRELARAGGHTTGAVAVQLLQWELGNAVLQALRCCCPTHLLRQDTCAVAYRLANMLG